MVLDYDTWHSQKLQHDILIDLKKIKIDIYINNLVGQYINIGR
jgi:hypothetical protein